MFGIEMMLKSLGLDPDEIKGSVERFGQMIVDLKQQMDRIEEKFDRLLSAAQAQSETADAEKPTLKLIGEKDNG